MPAGSGGLATGPAHQASAGWTAAGLPERSPFRVTWFGMRGFGAIGQSGSRNLCHADKFLFARATDGAGIGRHAELDIPADGTQVEARFGQVFALLHGL